MFLIDSQSRQAVYIQLIEQVERFILMGVLAPDDAMPSVRSLSLDLAINPNTIQKAYTDLDRRGIIYSLPGKGSFVAPDARQILAQERASYLAQIEDLAAELALAGIDKSSALNAVENGYKRKLSE